jgi:uncharacterized membrane protein
VIRRDQVRLQSLPTGGAAGLTALLGVIVAEQRTFTCYPVDIRRAVAHNPVIVGADVKPANIVAMISRMFGLPAPDGLLDVAGA